MENNNEIPTTNGAAPADNPISPAQPIVGQPSMAPAGATSAAPTAPTNNKKKLFIIGGIAAGIAVIALVAVLLVIFLGHGTKTVSCTMNTTAMGITISGENNVQVGDGKILSSDIVVNADLATMNELYKDYEKEMVDEIIDRYKSKCEDHCVFDQEYIEGDHVKITLHYDEEGVDEVVYTYGIEDKTAQEIADELQKDMEDSDTTCTQR